jgi:hypothetical protein
LSDAFTEDQIDAGRRMFVSPSRFMLRVAKLEQLPPNSSARGIWSIRTPSLHRG